MTDKIKVQITNKKQDRKSSIKLWEIVVDFTNIDKDGISIDKLLSQFDS